MGKCNPITCRIEAAELAGIGTHTFTGEDLLE